MNGDATNCGQANPNNHRQASSERVLRAFIAIDLPTPVLTALNTLQQQLQSALRVQASNSALRWSPTQNLHLTLRFLGDTTMQQREDVVLRLGALLAKWEIFSLGVNVSGQALGGFPNLRQPRVLWSGVEGDMDVLRRLQAEVEVIVQGAGFSPETKPYSPHLTLARAAREADGRAIAQAARVIDGYVQQLPTSETIRFGVDHVTLYQSELRAGSSVYTPLAVFPLARSDD